MDYFYAFAGGAIFGTFVIDLLPHVQYLQDNQEHHIKTTFPLAYAQKCVGFMLTWFSVEGMKVIQRYKKSSNLALIPVTATLTISLTTAFVFPMSEAVAENFNVTEYVEDVVAIIIESLVGGVLLYISLIKIISNLRAKFGILKFILIVVAFLLSGHNKPDNVHMHWQFSNNLMIKGAGSWHTVYGKRNNSLAADINPMRLLSIFKEFYSLHRFQDYSSFLHLCTVVELVQKNAHDTQPVLSQVFSSYRKGNFVNEKIHLHVQSSSQLTVIRTIS